MARSTNRGLTSITLFHKRAQELKIKAVLPTAFSYCAKATG
jgi:hypothetical protein